MCIIITLGSLIGLKLSILHASNPSDRPTLALLKESSVIQCYNTIILYIDMIGYDTIVFSSHKRSSCSQKIRPRDTLDRVKLPFDTPASKITLHTYTRENTDKGF